MLPLAQLWMETDSCRPSLCDLLLALPVQCPLLALALVPVACRCVHGRPHHCCAPTAAVSSPPTRLQAPAAGVQRPAAAYSHGSGVMTVWPFY